jgi:hypothetical protein
MVELSTGVVADLLYKLVLRRLIFLVPILFLT